MKTVMVRDLQGKPVQAELIRRLRLKGFEKCNLALVKTKGQLTVTELSSGAQLAFAWESLTQDGGKEIIEEAKLKIKEHGLSSFHAGVKAVIQRFNGEVLNA